MRKRHKRYLIQSALFIITIITTTRAGVEWMGLNEREMTWSIFAQGLLFSIPFLGILTIHEFGHYITAKIYKVKVTLPYYIPFYIPFLNTIGTMGAFIRIKSPLKSKREIFDIGVAGPLAGFVAALVILFYGFTHLPEPEHIYQIHPQYKTYGLDYDKHVYSYEFSRNQDSIQTEAYKKTGAPFINFLERMGWVSPEWRTKPFKPQEEYISIAMDKNLLLLFFENYVADNSEWIPNEYEIFHYPFIFAGFLALFFTALNLLPIGQLDGGHILFGLFGNKGHLYISRTIFILLVYFSGVGVFKNNFIGNVFLNIENLLIFGPLYLYFLYFLFSRFSENWKNNLMAASCIFAAQFFTELLFPAFTGISALYLVFSILIGRFLGLQHPPAYYEEPLDLKRKVIGWISLLIFILCFTPNLFNIVTFRP